MVWRLGVRAAWAHCLQRGGMVIRVLAWATAVEAASASAATIAPASELLIEIEDILGLSVGFLDEQATVDTSRDFGFAAALVAAVPSRTQSWIYDARGQNLSRYRPRSDVADVTAYTCYETTSGDYRRGDLRCAADALGMTTLYRRYERDLAGNLPGSVDPIRVVERPSNDPRPRLSSRPVADLRTIFTHDPAEFLVRFAPHRGGYFSYGYDTAQRLSSVFDELGNRIDCTLDAAGRGVSETVVDPAAQLRRSVQRSFDALGCIERVIGRDQ